MILVDTSIWIQVFADRDGAYTRALRASLTDLDVVLTRFQQLELLQGCRDERQWQRLHEYLERQDYLEARTSTWPAAARIYFAMRKRGVTVRSAIDCLIAQIAIDHEALLLHNDRDFDRIGEHFPLLHRRWAG